MNAPFGISGNGPLFRFEDREALGWLPRGLTDGLVLSNDGTDATNDIGVAAGSARSTVRIVDGSASTLARDQMDLDLPINIIKQLDVAFAPENYDPEGFPGSSDGTGRSGGRSSSALSNTSWQAILVGGGGLAPDVFFHDSLTQSSILAEMQKIGGYTAYRHIGGFVRASAAITAFTQYADGFVMFTTPSLDVNNATPGLLANTGTFALVPTGVKMRVLFNAYYAPAGGAFLVSSLDQADAGPGVTTAPLATAFNGTTTMAVQAMVVCSTTATFRYRTDANNTFRLSALGYWHPRGKDS